MTMPLKLALASGILLLMPLGCMSFKKPFAFESAPTPDGWPHRTPIGEVQVKEYPEYREAVADGGEVEPVFRTLFNHIKDNDIAMTAPVDMSYDAEARWRRWRFCIAPRISVPSARAKA